MYWGYLSLGLLLFVLAGLLIASAVYEGGTLVWTTGMLALLLGALSTGAALLASRSPRAAGAGPEPAAVSDPSAVPRLGEMLVKSGLISRADLDRALSRQKGSTKRLGQLLVEMGVMTHAQVAAILEEQLSRRAFQARGGSQTETG
jgi:hypothetical protein